MHLCIYPFTIRVKFMPRAIDQVILICDQGKEISDTILDVRIEEWQCSLAILNLSFEQLQIWTVGIQ